MWSHSGIVVYVVFMVISFLANLPRYSDATDQILLVSKK